MRSSIVALIATHVIAQGNDAQDLDWEKFGEDGVLGQTGPNEAQDLDWDQFGEDGVLGDSGNDAQDLDWDQFGEDGVLGGTYGKDAEEAFMKPKSWFNRPRGDKYCNILTTPEMQQQAMYVYMGIALEVALETGNNVFRYKSAADYYDAGSALGDTNWWKLANQILGYGTFGTWSLFFLTSVPAVSGVATDLNYLVWTWGSAISWSVLTVGGWMLYYSYDKAYQLVRDNDANAANATIVKNMVEMELLEKLLVGTVVEVAMIYYMPGWIDFANVAKREADPEAYNEMYECF